MAGPQQLTSTSPGAAATTSRPPLTPTPSATTPPPCTPSACHSNGNDRRALPTTSCLFTDSGHVLPNPAQMGADEGFLLREWRRAGDQHLAVGGEHVLLQCHGPWPRAVALRRTRW
ncbi:clathrin light chain 2 isoform X2 [Triticum aestivum]|uniref:clathrin light chain 2 isoform X2 n=1 Tax=Triticum aestivum TaxID=4565 RepID=UPI001D022186|nr:clathrin light chain 2-like isoform X2 [Triticum aestivum]